MLKLHRFRQLWPAILFTLPVLSAAVDTQPAMANAQVGDWSALIETKLVPIHMVLGPNGKVLMWQRPKLAPEGPQSILWTPPAINSSGNGTFNSVPAVSTDIFCAGVDHAPSGRILLAGGHEGGTAFDPNNPNFQAGEGSNDINVYDFFKNTWFTYLNKMNQGRWYPSVAYNANGEGVIFSGTVTDENPNPLPQVWGNNATIRSLTSATNVSLNTLPYNWMYLAPDGRMFVAGPFKASKMLNTNGSGSWANVGGNSNQNRFYGSVAFYNVGKVMIVGGSNDTNGTPTKTAQVINLNAANPQWINTGQMQFARRHHTATILPDGNVLVAGGTSSSSFNNLNGTVFQAELWNQSTGLWSTMASYQKRRTYHSSAVLLNDARVAFCGGGLPRGAGKEGSTDRTEGNFDCEIFAPPYLFKGGRPTISSAPTAINYNTNFNISTPEAADISKVAWVRLSAMTHGYNAGQRFANLIFTKTSGGLNITAPKNKNNVPAGFYQLFILNSNGVPSEARIIKIS